MKKTSFLLILGVLAVLFVGLYTGYLFWQKSSVNSGLQQANALLTDYRSQILQYENEEVLGAINAKQAYTGMLSAIIEWSEVITAIRETVPQSEDGDLAEVLSYSGSSGNQISMNVRTIPGSAAPYFDIADLIEAFDESEYFTSSFVSSISSGVDDEGQDVLTFLFTTTYVDPTVIEADSAILR